MTLTSAGARAPRLQSARNLGLPRLPANCYVRSGSHPLLTILCSRLLHVLPHIRTADVHHDESLHSVYSRNLYIGNGYTHDPMMHGREQINLIALHVWSVRHLRHYRFAYICGVWVVMSPFFLRNRLGRWPALIASFLLLLSPGVLTLQNGPRKTLFLRNGKRS